MCPSYIALIVWSRFDMERKWERMANRSEEYKTQSVHDVMGVIMAS